MKVIYNRLIPFTGYSAINLFGILFVRKGTKISERLMRHEQIHTRQMKDMLFIPFYIIYVLEWLFLLLRFFNWHKAYRAISFEREAYDHQDDENYLNHRAKFAWLKFI